MAGASTAPEATADRWMKFWPCAAHGGEAATRKAGLNGIPVEAGDRAQPASDRRPGAAVGFQVAGEALDVGTADLEQPQVPLLAPPGELAQVQ
jgi:hypothetical protein